MDAPHEGLWCPPPAVLRRGATMPKAFRLNLCATVFVYAS